MSTIVKSVSHINTLHAALDEVIAGVKAGTLNTVAARAVNSAAGKRITAFRTQLEYHKLRRETPKIAALS